MSVTAENVHKCVHLCFVRRVAIEPFATDIIFGSINSDFCISRRIKLNYLITNFGISGFNSNFFALNSYESVFNFQLLTIQA